MLKQQSNKSQPTLIARGVSLVADSGVAILPQVNITITSQRYGLVGQNGVGKSTLLKILCQKVDPSGGSVTRNGSIAYLPQMGFSEQLSVKQLLKNQKNASEGVFRSYTGQFGLPKLDLAAPLASYSGGERMKIALSFLLSQNPDVLILDEPTNNLDLPARQFLYSFVARYKKALLVVSHDRALLGNVDRILELTPKGLIEYGGNYEFYSRQKDIESQAHERRLSTAKEELDKVQQKKEAKLEQQRQLQKSARNRSYNTGMPKQMRGHRQRKGEESMGKRKRVFDDRAENALLRVEELESVSVKEGSIRLDLVATQVPNGKLMIECTDVSFAYSNAFQPVIDRFNLQVYGPARIAIEGKNGSGKTTLVKLITGDLVPTSGAVTVGTDRIAYLDQFSSVLDPRATLFEQCRAWHSQYTDVQIRRWLGRFLFRDNDAFKPTAILSGGERIKAALALVLGGDTPPQLLTLDEPTNNLDLGSIKQLESALRQYEGCLLVISHDQAFLEGIGINKRVIL